MARAVPIVLLAVACMAIGLWLYPFDADGPLAVIDGVLYGEAAERQPLPSVHPHHPLFHVFVLGVMEPLEAMGVSKPGHVACRIVAAMGAAWLLLQVSALAGRRRILVGSGFAFVLFCTRGFIVELGMGETVLPATAAALFALTRAARPAPNLLAVGCALTLACLLRQDNIFLTAGVAVALATGLPRGTRTSGIFRVVSGAGAATMAAYLAAWLLATGGREHVFAWLTRLAQHGSWSGTGALSVERLATYLSSMALGATGRIAPPADDHPAIGAAYLVACVLPGLALRGSSPAWRLGLAMLGVLIPRGLFHAWYEAENFEWTVLPLAFSAAFGSALARGEPATRRLWRAVGAWALALLAAWLLFAHVPSTWRLRQRRLATAVAAAVDVDLATWRVFAWEARTGAALYLMGVDHQLLRTGPNVRGEDAIADMLTRLAEHPGPTVVLGDRFVYDGMPFTMKHPPSWILDSDALEVPPGFEILRRDGIGYGFRYVP